MTIFYVTQKALNHLRFLYLFLFFSLILPIIYNYEKLILLLSNFIESTIM